LLLPEDIFIEPRVLLICAADKGSGFLWNVATCLTYYTAWHFRRLSTYLPPWGLKRAKATSVPLFLCQRRWY